MLVAFEQKNMWLSKVPKISIVVPCYNCEASLYKTIKSAMLNDILPFEILLYDDCSTDGTPDVIRSIVKDFTGVKSFKGDVNRGAGYARKFLIVKSSGDYIAFLDSDDAWFPNKIDKLIAIIKQENPDIITSSYEIEDENSRKLGTRILPRKINSLMMHFSNWLPMSMTIVRSNLAGISEMPLIRRRQDYAFWLNIFKKNKSLKCHVILEPLGVYTRRKESLSSSSLSNIRSNYDMFRNVVGHNQLTAGFLVLCNSFIRIFRI